MIPYISLLYEKKLVLEADRPSLISSCVSSGNLWASYSLPMKNKKASPSTFFKMEFNNICGTISSNSCRSSKKCSF